MIRTYNDTILEHYGAYVVSTPRNFQVLNSTPFDIPLRWHIDPLRRSSGDFLNLLQRLDSLTFGPEGMPMDKWVFYDCAELPGFIYGFATPASEFTPSELETFGLDPAYDGPVPVSMYIAIPMHEPGAWFGHNLASLNRIFPERNLHHLGTMTKAISLKACGATRFFGATQWTSRAIHIHSKFGPLELHTTYTPAHSVPETLTYAFHVDDRVLRAAAGDPDIVLDRPEPTLMLDATDSEGMRSLQTAIEGGADVVLIGPPTYEEDRILHGLHLRT
jgi:hypothetical protein